MTTAKIQTWQSESPAIGSASAEGAGDGTSTSSNVITLEFNTGRPLPVKHARSLNSRIQQSEAIPERAARLAAARQRLAGMVAEEGTIANLRLAAGLSQAKLAERAGTSQAHIARIECGKNDPATDLISRLAVALNRDEETVFRAVRKSRLAAEKCHD